jgi:3-phenylpropionate/cinnamic acid dioxygenase small subunit
MTMPTPDDQAEIIDLLARYCLALDRHDLDAWVSLFTDDAEYRAFGRTFAGHAGLRGMMEGAPRGLHLGGLPLIAVEGDSASVIQNALFVDAATHESRLVMYTDALVRAAHGWRFHRRSCQFVGTDGLGDRPARAVRPADDEAAILRTLTEYCFTCDDGRFDALAECFTEDATLVAPGERVEGRAAIVAWYVGAQGTPKQRGKHLTTNVQCDLDGDRATVVADFAWLRFTSQGKLVPGTTGRYVDEMERSGDRWRFHRREIQLLRAPE